MQCVVDSAGVVVPSDVAPCPGWFVLTPAEAEALVGQITTEGLAQVGVTPQTLGSSYLFGFSAVTAIVALAFVVRLAVALVNKA